MKDSKGVNSISKSVYHNNFIKWDSFDMKDNIKT